MKIPYWLALLLVLPVLLSRCAQVAQPPGGKKDTLAPVLLKSVPANRQLNYAGRVVELAFDEYVNIENLQQKTVITPQDSNTFQTKLLPQGLRITFDKPLQPNTTYTINFSDAVRDITERNVATETKVVFSTGPRLDSLGLSGAVTDAHTRLPAQNVVVGLFSPTDTLPVTRKRPAYFARTDTSGLYRIENVRVGTYKIFAFDDADLNLVNNTPGERIGFRDSLLTLDRTRDNVDVVLFRSYTKPRIVRRERTDETVGLELNVGIVDYKLRYGRFAPDAPVSTSAGSATATNVGATTATITTPTDSTPAAITAITGAVVNASPLTGNGAKPADTLQSFLERDRLIRLFRPTGRAAGDTLFVTISALDSAGKTTELRERIYFSPLRTKARNRTPFTAELDPTPGAFLDNTNLVFDLTFNKPVFRFDPVLVQLYADSARPDRLIASNFRWTNHDAHLSIRASSRATDTLTLRLRKGAFVSVQGDTLTPARSRFRVADPDSYGLISGRVTTERVKPTDKNLIVELLDERYKVLRTVIGAGTYSFGRLRPGRYRLRLILDRNANRRYDTGDISAGIQPEEIIYYPDIIPLKQNFELTDQDL
jgi:hypothetical protein